MMKTIFLLAVVSLDTGEARIRIMEFEDNKSCVQAEVNIEATTNSFAKCMQREIRID